MGAHSARIHLRDDQWPGTEQVLKLRRIQRHAYVRVSRFLSQSRNHSTPQRSCARRQKFPPVLRILKAVWYIERF